MELSVSSETTFFNMKLQLEICPQLRTGSSAEDRGRIDTRVHRYTSAHSFFTNIACGSCYDEYSADFDKTGRILNRNARSIR